MCMNGTAYSDLDDEDLWRDLEEDDSDFDADFDEDDYEDEDYDDEESYEDDEPSTDRDIIFGFQRGEEI